MLEAPYGDVSLEYNSDYPEMIQLYDENKLPMDVQIEIECMPQRMWHDVKPDGIWVKDLALNAKTESGLYDFPPF